jgi:hypothetical protein
MPQFELERYFARHEFDAPYLLSSSDMESVRVRELLALADEEGLREPNKTSCAGVRAHLGHAQSARRRGFRPSWP